MSDAKNAAPVPTKTYETGAVRSVEADESRLDLITPIGFEMVVKAAPIACYTQPNPYLARATGGDPCKVRAASALASIRQFQAGKRPDKNPRLALAIAANYAAAACDPAWSPPQYNPPEHLRGLKWDDPLAALLVEDYPACDVECIAWAGIHAVGRAYAEGLAKYPPNNWMKGMPADDLVNHAMQHLHRFIAGDASEDHLGHAGWNLMTALHSLVAWPDLNEGRLLPMGLP